MAASTNKPERRRLGLIRSYLHLRLEYLIHLLRTRFQLGELGAYSNN